jgi:hypothetical protein
MSDVAAYGPNFTVNYILDSDEKGEAVGQFVSSLKTSDEVKNKLLSLSDSYVDR